MAVRALVIFALVSVAVAACNEVPYKTGPLGVTQIINKSQNITQTFTYGKNKKLNTYLSKSSSGDTLAHIKFFYRNDELISFTSDSTRESYKRSFIYRTGDGSVDSTYFYGIDTLGLPDTTYFVSARKIVYGANSKPVSVSVKGADTNELLSELTWTGDNITHLTYSAGIETQSLVIDDVSIEHDGQPCIYIEDEAFIYILPMNQLYWYSKNNPDIFTNSSGTRANSYVYNKIGYPSYYEDSGSRYGVTYKELR